ncbi:hypothetical protein F5148DRAFT_46596 [Russula earlei]|uniref:Uncharacterized protein n=1 Tax=Russula earlei TaxID=71964 RepID=A0ACC0U888_9AGAM|nr:hypothetical protein F5148DRAFT_46596 [Russula earlei]
MLPDDILMEIYFLLVNLNYWRIGTGGWRTLVHVCQRWRNIVFTHPRGLNLQLVYKGIGPMSEMLHVWPVLPVVISRGSSVMYRSSIWGNIAAALKSEHHNRICEIDLSPIPASHWERLAAGMQKPFPHLTSLRIFAEGNTVTPLPDSFLGGSAPLLRQLELGNCPFPGIPTLLLSAHVLVRLSLWNIPHSGYFSPQDLVTALSGMPRLAILGLKFQSPRSRPDPASRPPLSLTRSVLPALAELLFKGVHEYLEDLLAPIEAPLLKKLNITFFMDLDFVVPQLHRLISRTEMFKTCHRASVYPSDRAIQFVIFGANPVSPEITLEIACRDSDWQLSSLAQICNSSLLLLSTLVRLDIVDPVLPSPQSHWKDDIETTQWLELLDPFTAAKDLRLSDQVARHVCRALEELAEVRVLPALRNIFLSLQPLDLVPKFVERFITARQLSGHPVAFYPWGDQGNYKKIF